MEHIPTPESDVEKAYRIAKELGIGLEEAAITCDAFQLAFSDEALRLATRQEDCLFEAFVRKASVEVMEFLNGRHPEIRMELQLIIQPTGSCFLHADANEVRT